MPQKSNFTKTDTKQGAEQFLFGTKGETLSRLSPLISGDIFCSQIIFTVQRWLYQSEIILEEIQTKFGNKTLAVRSSATDEDNIDSSNAGKYLSLIDVEPTPTIIAHAINRVIQSYGEKPSNNQVLVQPTVNDVAISGVATTRDLDTGAPYYVINYDDVTGRTDTVTGGAESKCIFVHRSHPQVIRSDRFRKLIEAIRNIEKATSYANLDIEYCITKSEDIYILQVRPIAAQSRWESVADSVIKTGVDDIRKWLDNRLSPTPDLFGKTTILGVMPDWNPAEIIGNSPRPLALSLYKKLITDDVWWRARTNMGYLQVPHPLLVDLNGHPYIDVRLSLNSFLPANIDKESAEPIINSQLSILSEKRELHDKIEFFVAITCFDFCTLERIEDLARMGVPRTALEKLKQGIHKITNQALNNFNHRLNSLLEKTKNIEHLHSSNKDIETLNGLFKSCMVNGTLPFSELARHAFIGISFLRSLVTKEAITEEDSQCFLASISTVAGQLVHDMYAYSIGKTDQKTFLDLYGHLRPGTYDVLSWRYDERPSLYLGHDVRSIKQSKRFKLQAGKRELVNKLLIESGFSISPEELFSYIAKAVSAREEAKFEFSRSISDALLMLTQWAEKNGFSRDDLSYLEIETLLKDSNDKARLQDAVANGKEKNQLMRFIKLPALIDSLEDVDVIRQSVGQPTFVTNTSVTAPIYLLQSEISPNIEDCIVLIESADPGYDWLFSHNIKGLITKYGGANSHMAIRCAEFALPAAIGCGGRLFKTIQKASWVELNCTARMVRATN